MTRYRVDISEPAEKAVYIERVSHVLRDWVNLL